MGHDMRLASPCSIQENVEEGVPSFVDEWCSWICPVPGLICQSVQVSSSSLSSGKSFLDREGPELP